LVAHICQQLADVGSESCANIAQQKAAGYNRQLKAGSNQ